MSLAMYAAPFDNNSNNSNNMNSNMNNNMNNTINSNNDNDIINKKRQSNNKTQKRYYTENHDQQKVNSVLATIHQNLVSSEDEEDSLGDFNPPPPPQSVGVQKTKAVEESKNGPVSFNNGNEYDSNSSSIANNIFKTLGKSPQPVSGGENNLDLNNFNTNYADNKTAEEYYSKYLPGINNLTQNKINKQYYNSNATAANAAAANNVYGTNDIIMQKINYMINLLEEQQDEKTNNVTEEVVLYSFLGIFIIFVVDSFARVGKYTR
jgi:hypothetical protein